MIQNSYTAQRNVPMILFLEQIQIKMVLLGAIDQGTSSTRFLVYESDSGEFVTSHQIEVRQIFPQTGWVEMNPREIFDTVTSCINRVTENLNSMNIPVSEIVSIGIANQRETTVVWDRATGKSLLLLPLASRMR
ncbi:hypothetical protein FO519_009684 [Halicephalobus sp. NKZ332]|nr:hypothetical protein FO519_009684 [Halicephalobus sp. NKZ332]